jgi:hypothetical protein
MLKVCMGVLIMFEALIFGCTWIMGYHALTTKEKIKLTIVMNVFVGVLLFGFYLIS